MNIPRKNLIVIILLVFVCGSIQAQQIKGTVKEHSGEILPRVNIIIKTNKTLAAISEFFIAGDNGSIDYTLKKSYNNTIYIEASALNYEKIIDSIVNPQIDKEYRFDLILYPKSTQLEEVIISERKKFTIKKDTVVFNPEAYKDGTERKVEDVLKKLPGVQVAEDGSIKYRGKDVSAVQLDGDDLFGAKYTIGTKNISIDMVDQIEAIENYSKNPLLKGIENSNAVALNLKLKKNRTNYSGTSDLGYGYGDRNYVDAATTLIGVSSNLKSFGIVEFNNTGNYPGFDRSYGGLLASDSKDESDVFSKKIINETPITNSLGYKRSSVDERWTANYNVLYKFSKKARIKANVLYLKDKVFQEERFQNLFFTSTDTFSYIDLTQITQKPEAKGLDLAFTYNTSKKSLLEIVTSVSKNDQASINNFIRNQNDSNITRLSSEDFLIKNKLQFTYKLNKTNALQYTSLYSRNNIPQKFNTFGNFFSNEDAINSYFQFSEYRKETFQNRLALLGRKNNLKYAFTAGVNHHQNPFLSFLQENEVLISDFQNEFQYQKTDVFALFSNVYESKSWKIEPSLLVKYITQDIEKTINILESKNKKSFIVAPSLSLAYKINAISRFNFRGNYEQNTPEENFLFANGIITNNRAIVSNEVSLDLVKKHNYSLGYRLNSLYDNIEANAVIGYINRSNTFLSNLEINSNVTSTTYFQSPIDLGSWFFNASVERYMRFIQTSLKISSTYSISEFKNFVNQSDIRDGQSKSYEGVFFAKTAFRIPVNFENFLTYNITSFSVDGQSSNTNYGIKNSLKAIVKPNKKWLFTITYDYFKPDTTRNEDFSFLDFEIKYKPKEIKWISGRFVGKNLLDNRVFQQIQNSDFSTTVYRSNLIPRYFMLSLDVSF